MNETNDMSYSIRAIREMLERHEKEALVFYTEIRTNLEQVQRELRDIQKVQTEWSKDIEFLKKANEKHDQRINTIYVALVVLGFFIVIIMASK